MASTLISESTQLADQLSEPDRLISQADARIGELLETVVDTPALVLDLDKFTHNLLAMQHFCRTTSHVQLRPHCKTHKCSTIAKLQLQKGAIGVCTAKLSEAQVLLEAGVRGVLITSPQVTERKIAQLLRLSTIDPTLMVTVDSERNVLQLQAAAVAAQQHVRCLVDIEVGQRRTGVPLERAFSLVRLLAESSHTDFCGIQAYCGHLQHVKEFEERSRLSIGAMRTAAEFVAELRSLGFEVPIFTGTGTGTYDIDSRAIDSLTDIQPGSYVCMDQEYLEVQAEDAKQFSALFADNPMSVLAGVVSTNHAPEQVTLDAGLKAIYRDGPAPRVTWPAHLVDATYEWAGDEHAYLRLPKETGKSPQAGDVVLLRASHCDPTINRMRRLSVDQVRRLYLPLLADIR
eukprot:CAMPEP_0174246206 /NCGR_PEP_ID=MMETSP0417-20130205/41931_1 /TAXON_ID=242541 /ORGANISM="Mayorella sp, Strain BSH-02190019" /LENGTH=401 /DNA_ID=CAMNT_0015326059 /DNA_START=50 /DNA_END=1255 /DNA_ORIENTATION=-